MTRQYRFEVAASQTEVWVFHQSAGALEALTPPGQDFEVLHFEPLAEGALQVFRVRQFGIRMVWQARIELVEAPIRFVDRIESGPFPRWRHEHRFEALPNGRCLVIDSIDYDPPGWLFAPWIDKLLVGPKLDAMFAYRARATKAALEKAEDFARTPREGS